MYHIKADKRSQSSASLIIKGFYDCLEEKSFSEITITDLQRASTIGRATFYRLFDSVTDILAYECDTLFDRLLTDGDKINPTNKEEAFTYFFRYWTENPALIKAISESGHMEIINASFHSHSRAIGRIMMTDFDDNESNTDYIISLISSSLFSVISIWIQHGQNKTAKELSEIFTNSIKTLYNSFSS